MELAGHECVGFCEFDKFATASYISMHLLTDEQRKALEDIPIKKRQKEILKEEYRNGEWYANDIRRVYAGDIPKEEDKPTYFFIENVKNLLSVNGGWDFARLLIEM